MILRRLSLTLLPIVFLCTIVYSPQQTFAARHATVHSAAGKSSKNSKHNKHRRRRPVWPRLYSGVPGKMLSTKATRIAAGVMDSLKTISKNQWRVGIVHAKLDDGYRVALIKAKDKAVGFERTEDLVHRLDSSLNIRCVAAVNAN